MRPSSGQAKCLETLKMPHCPCLVSLPSREWSECACSPPPPVLSLPACLTTVTVLSPTKMPSSAWHTCLKPLLHCRRAPREPVLPEGNMPAQPRVACSV